MDAAENPPTTVEHIERAIADHDAEMTKLPGYDRVFDVDRTTLKVALGLARVAEMCTH